MSSVIKLSEEQKAIVENSDSTAIQVVASAGSGKTRVLTERVKHIIDTSKRGHALALTFTNKAAEEMEERLGEDYVDRTWISTIHSFAQSILESYGHTIGLASDFQIYERNEDRLEIFFQSLRDDGQEIDEYLDITDSKEKKNRQRIMADYLESFSHIKREMVDCEQDAKKLCPKFPHIWRAYNAYNVALDDSGGMDYEDILAKAYKVLREQEWVADNYRIKYKHVCVDEAQDLNKIQYEFIKELCREKVKSLMLVGDPDQMIYGFNGSTAKYMTELFVKDFNPSRFHLKDNYRSSSSVILAANKLKPNSQKQASTFPIAGEVRVEGFEDEESEAEWVVKSVKSLLDMGQHADIEGDIGLDSMVIIARNQFIFSKLEDKLSEAGVPYYLKRGSRREKPTSTLGKVIDYSIRLKLNEKDWVNGSKLCKLLNILEPSVWGGEDLLLELSYSVENVDDDTLGKLYGAVIKLISGLEAGSPKIRSFVTEVEKLCKLHMAEADEAERALKELECILRDWLKFRQKGLGESLQAFRNAIALGQIDSNDDKGLMLSSVHNMKGLEKDIVFIIGMVEGVFPDYRANSTEKMNEELNSAFVAVTRSKRFLYLTYPKTRMMPWGDVKRQRTSRFIQQIEGS